MCVHVNTGEEDVALSGLASDQYQRCLDRHLWKGLMRDATGQLEAVILQQQQRVEEQHSQQRAEHRPAKIQIVGTLGAQLVHLPVISVSQPMTPGSVL